MTRFVPVLSSAIAPALSVRRAWRHLTLAVLGVVACAASVSAQTIIVKDAPAGGEVEVVINNKVVVNDKANLNGRATLAVPGATADLDALVAVDTCGTKRRILITQPSVALAPVDVACTRRDIPGLFLVRNVSTIVFTVEGQNPRLLLRQGPFNPDAPPRTWAAVPSGLMIYGGAGFGAMSNFALDQCGTVTDCTADGTGFSLSAGAEFWFGRFVAAEVGFLRPAVATTEGAGTAFSFDSELTANVLTAGVKVGGPVGPVRIYGRGGVNRTRALSHVSQKIDDDSYTIDDVTTTVPGGTQVMEYETQGYGWYFGGGLELWLNRHVATFLQFDYQKLKGTDLADSEGILNDRHMQVGMGIKVRLGK